MPKDTPKSKKALITGVTGQDGSYLAEFLLSKGYEVHGVMRRSSSFNTGRVEKIYQDMHSYPKPSFLLHYGDLADASAMYKILNQVKPDEIYNLGAQSHVRVSFDLPEYTADIDALGTLRLLDVVKEQNYPIRFYQAGSSEMFGKVLEIPQTEKTPFNPQSPYACAKTFAHFIVKNYREAYGLFAVNGILFNHESPRRGATFVTKKITRGLARIVSGKESKIFLGNLDAKRDWGYAPDYVEAMYLMLQASEPDDYVVATGENHSVREFIEIATEVAGIDIVWQGVGLEEKGIDRHTGKVIIEIDPKYFRPTEVDILLGDYSKAREKLNWQPKILFKDLVKIMMSSDLKEEGLVV